MTDLTHNPATYFFQIKNHPDQKEAKLGRRVIETPEFRWAQRLFWLFWFCLLLAGYIVWELEQNIP